MSHFCTLTVDHGSKKVVVFVFLFNEKNKQGLCFLSLHVPGGKLKDSPPRINKTRKKAGKAPLFVEIHLGTLVGHKFALSLSCPLPLAAFLAVALQRCNDL